jgi:hypothetical protein
MASISHELTITIINCTPSIYCNDGTYLLWAITNNIHRNNIAFVKLIREKTVNATLAHHENDVEKYLIFIKNHSCMIAKKSTTNE